MTIDCNLYPFTDGYDELLEAPGVPRAGAEGLCHFFSTFDVSYALNLPREGTQHYDLIWMIALKALSAYQMYRRHVSVRGQRRRTHPCRRC